MTLTLVIPGLLWPRQVMRDTLYDADFPALQTLLGKGRRGFAAAASTRRTYRCLAFSPISFVITQRKPT